MTDSRKTSDMEAFEAACIALGKSARRLSDAMLEAMKRDFAAQAHPRHQTDPQGVQAQQEGPEK